MTETELVKKVRNLISDSKTKKALEQISRYASQISDKELKNEILILEGRLSSYEKEHRLGTNSNDNLSAEKNKLNESILDIINTINAEEDANREINNINEGINPSENKNFPRKKDIKIITSFFIYFFGFIALGNYLIGLLGEIRYPDWLIYLHLPFIWVLFAKFLMDIADKLKLKLNYKTLIGISLAGMIILFPLSYLRTYYFLSPFSVLDKNLRIIVFPFEEEYTCSDAKININRILSKDIKEIIDSEELNITIKEGRGKDYPQGKLGAKDFIHKRGAHFGIWGTFKENCKVNTNKIELNYYYAYFSKGHPLEYKKSEWNFEDIDSVRKDLTKEILIVAKLIGSNFLFGEEKWEEGIEQYKSAKIDCNEKLLSAKIELGISIILELFKEDKMPKKEYYIPIINKLLDELFKVMTEYEKCNFTLSDKMKEFRNIMIK